MARRDDVVWKLVWSRFYLLAYVTLAIVAFVPIMFVVYPPTSVPKPSIDIPRPNAVSHVCHYKVTLKIMPMNRKTNRWVGTAEDRKEIGGILLNRIGKGYENNGMYENMDHEFRIYVTEIKGHWARVEMEIDGGDPGTAYLHCKKNGHWHYIVAGSYFVDYNWISDGHYVPEYIRYIGPELQMIDPD